MSDRLIELQSIRFLLRPTFANFLFFVRLYIGTAREPTRSLRNINRASGGAGSSDSTYINIYIFPSV